MTRPLTFAAMPLTSIGPLDLFAVGACAIDGSVMSVLVAVMRQAVSRSFIGRNEKRADIAAIHVARIIHATPVDGKLLKLGSAIVF
jgi:hypothetical protein